MSSLTARLKYLTFILVWLFASPALADLTPEQQAARDEGLMLYQQHMGGAAIEPLRVAAEAGDRTAQYFLGETLRLNNMFMTAESRKWYEAAAEQGDLFAMLRLSSSSDLCHEMGTCGPHSTDWRSTALALAHERAAQGDVEAMQALFNAGQGLEWLEKAAEGGYAPAQELLAAFYSEGEGWFLLPGRRQAAIEKWYKASAEGGFPLGMMS
ncbi:sel1 repeat family protein [Pseudomonas neustonica]|uniref:Sel1 repeat family protein n=1 Tax=Pseudomonas neustonica TaxID=2487346 RepID=A0ABX9XCS9_9PSED|nr:MULTISPECIES: sel1 repeat family protein [Pseudomonas]ROZ79301.1 sel1 repeat family protein [Pseudomonas sp. SSM44]ROZ80118.1 sel1 repeat family protein [Pseudomonas neustonica]